MNWKDEGSFIWNSKNSRDFGLYMSKAPSISRPARKQEVVSVPGRNGDIIIQHDAWENRTVEMQVFSFGNLGDPEMRFNAIHNWLKTPGYRRLEDSFNPDHYMLAYYPGGDNIETLVEQAERGSLTFNAQPQRFLKSGERSISLTSGQKLRNPTEFDALPQITIKGTGVASLQVGDYVIAISEIGGEIVLDSAIQDAYADRGATNRNSSVSLTDFPVLSGTTEISWSGDGITGVSIAPNWWEL